MRLLLIVVCLLTFVAAVMPATLTNGDFEAVRDGQFVGWTATGPTGAVTVTGIPRWVRYSVKFNSAEYRTLRPYLRIQSGKGTVWFDNVAISDLPLVNPGFEQGDGQKLVGWGQDAPGERVFRDTTVAKDGKASVRLSNKESAMTRIWQDVPCEPEKEYELSFFWRAEDLAGNAYGEVYGLSPDGGLGRVIAQTPRIPFFAREQFGKHVCQLSLTEPGRASISQRISFSPADERRGWSVSVQVRVLRLDNGAVSLVVRPGPGATPLASAQITESSLPWRELSANFIPAAGEIEVALQVEGDAAVILVDNVSLGGTKIVPVPKVFEPVSIKENFSIPAKLSVGIRGKVGSVTASGIRLFAQALKQQVGCVSIGQDPLRGAERGVQLIVAPGDRMKRPSESYSLRVRRNRVTIIGADERGCFYGLTTLLQLARKTPDGYVFLAADIEDAPDMPFRASYVGSARLNETTRALVDRFARLRLNAAVFEDSVFYHLEDPQNRRDVQELFRYCREMGIEPIPELQSFGWAGALLQIDPNLAEGTQVVDEKIVLNGTEPAALAHPNVLRTEKTTIVITDDAHKLTFQEGRDYEVLPGELAYPFKKDAAPFKVRRTENSRIPDGATVLVSYDYVSRVENGNVPYCPNEPRVYEIMRRALKNTIRYLHPKYIHIGHDEPMQMGTDSRCANGGWSNAENFARDVWRLWHIVKAEDPQVRLMMWADAINPYHNGYIHKDPTAPAADMLPRDIIQCIWFYDAGQPLVLGWKSLQFFGERGYSMTGSPWYDPTCARNWSIVCKRAMDEGLPCIGTFYTSWDNRWQALEEMANTAWRAPEE